MIKDKKSIIYTAIVLAFVITTLFGAVSNRTMALGIDNELYVDYLSRNGIGPYFNPFVTDRGSVDDDVVCSDGSGGGANTSLTGKDNGEKIWYFLIGAGLSKEQAAGVMGNLYQESRFDPSLEQKTSRPQKGYGIAQWTGSRRTGLQNAAVAQGVPVSDLYFQLNYMQKESMSRTAKSSFGGGNEWAGLKKQKTVSDAMYYWHANFERSADSLAALERDRLAFAMQIFNDYSNKDAPVGSTSPQPTENCIPAGSGDGGAPLTNAVCSDVNRRPPDNYSRTVFPGTNLKTDARTLYLVNLANDCLQKLGQKKIIISQGSYCGSGCAKASGQSHNGGGTIDVSTKRAGLSSAQIDILIKVMREVGFAAWYRDGTDAGRTGGKFNFAGNEHIHAVALGATGAGAPGSPAQLTSYCSGRGGLSGDVDRHLKKIGRPLPDWALSVSPKCTRVIP